MTESIDIDRRDMEHVVRVAPILRRKVVGLPVPDAVRRLGLAGWRVEVQDLPASGEEQ